MMYLRLLLTLSLFAISISTQAQLTPFSQSSGSLNWKTIENDHVKVIYPEGFQQKAIYVANLIEHYSKVVGLSYGVKSPKKITLIVRYEMAMPNGFVARAPRRTEWFTSEAYTPVVGSLEWLQILSIHEYRHVVQQDDFHKNTVRYFNYLLGDMGINLADVISKKPWMAEGDSVYAETRYSDGGRGRSPRFLARLKGILLSGETPTYDQFINGTYQTALVDQYVYGYILISRGYQKFGEDFWEKVIDKITHGPHPFKFESAFKELTGEEFKDFYYSTFNELKETWSADHFENLAVSDYTVATNPKETDSSLYYIETNLNDSPTIYKKSGTLTKKVTEISYSEELSRADFFGSSAVLAEYIPHPRYGYKGYADLILVDLSTGAKDKITSGQRLYNPRFSIDGKTLFASEYTEDMAWNIQEFDRQGQRLRTLKLAGLNLVEAVPLDANTLVAIAIDKSGYKSLIKAKLGHDEHTTLLPASRNNLFALQTDGNGNILFEAQSNGATDVFKYDTLKNEVTQCTSSKIAAYAPSFAGANFYYSEETPYGKRVQKTPLTDCKPINNAALVSFNYLSEDPGDNYNKFTPVAFPDQNNLYTLNAEKYKPEDYDHFDTRGFIPHSWSFLGGRGLSLTVSTENYLGDFGTQIKLGSDAEENTPYSSVQIDFKRYWPIFSILGDARKRSADVSAGQEQTWDESAFGFGLTLPYIFKNQLYNGSLLLGYTLQRLETGDFELNDVDMSSATHSKYLDQVVSLSLSYSKELAHRSLISPWSASLFVAYEDVASENSKSMPGSYRTFGTLTLTTPGLFTNNGIKVALSGQKNREGTENYIFQTPAFDPLGYTYSRGYDYVPADEYGKVSFNYLFPIAYPDYNLGAWIYFKRIYMNLYMDHTKFIVSEQDTNLNSYGTELAFQTALFRFLPFEFGARYIHEVDPSKDDFEFYLGTSLQFF